MFSCVAFRSAKGMYPKDREVSEWLTYIGSEAFLLWAVDDVLSFLCFRQDAPLVLAG